MEYSTKLDTWYRPQPGRKFDGTFANGHTPYTKGKHLADYMTAEQIATFRAKGREAAMANLAKGWNNPNSGRPKKPVFAIKDGQKVRFESMADASRATGIDYHCISKVIHGCAKTAGGYKWKLATDTQHQTPNTK